MKEKVQQILERELNRLDLLSQAQGLDLSGFKALDLLIKCHSSFVGTTTNTTTPNETSPEDSPLDELLEGVSTNE